MKLTEKAKIFKNIWVCAYQRRYDAKINNDWDRYDGEQETILMCLKMRDTKWYEFDTEKQKYLF